METIPESQIPGFIVHQLTAGVGVRQLVDHLELSERRVVHLANKYLHESGYPTQTKFELNTIPVRVLYRLGKSAAEISERLRMPYSSVTKHIRHILAKDPTQARFQAQVRIPVEQKAKLYEKIRATKEKDPNASIEFICELCETTRHHVQTALSSK